MKKLIFSLAALAGVAMAGAAAAQESATIMQARRAGQIGERFDGYLGYVTAVHPALRRQVDAVNIRRRSLYSNLAARRGVSPQEVGITAACTLLRRISVGEYYFLGQGGWKRVSTSQSPVPGYCV